MLLVGFLAWVVVGLIVGFVVSKLVNLRGDDPKLGIAAAMAGAIVAGVLHAVISGTAVSAWSTSSLLWAALGASIAVVIFHWVRSRTISRDVQTSRRSY